LHLDGLAEDGEAVPEPSTLDVITKDALNRDALRYSSIRPRNCKKSSAR
jgi:hypothetical protein